MEAKSLLDPASCRGVVVSHIDLDGVAAAAIVLRAAGGMPGEQSRWLYRLSSIGRLAENLGWALAHLTPSGGVLLVADLAPQSSEVIRKLEEGGTKVELFWVDHHRWPPDAARSLWRLESKVVVVNNPESPCAAMLVRDLIYGGPGGDPVADRLVEMATDVDTGRLEDEVAVMWARWLQWSGPGAASRRKALLHFVRGELEPGWLKEEYRELAREYERRLSEAIKVVDIRTINGLSVAIVKQNDERLLHPDVKARILERVKADIILLVEGGKRLGIMSNTPKVDAARIAWLLGGGGHVKSAGAPMPKAGIGEVLKLIKRATSGRRS